MNKKIILQLFGRHGFYLYSKSFLKYTKNPLATILIGAIIDKWEYNNCNEFYYRLDDICNEFYISKDKARAILKFLVKIGVLIDKGLKGVPPKQYYDININIFSEIVNSYDLLSENPMNIHSEIQMVKDSEIQMVKDSEIQMDIYNKNTYTKNTNNKNTDNKERENEFSLFSQKASENSLLVAEPKNKNQKNNDNLPNIEILRAYKGIKANDNNIQNQDFINALKAFSGLKDEFFILNDFANSETLAFMIELLFKRTRHDIASALRYMLSKDCAKELHRTNSNREVFYDFIHFRLESKKHTPISEKTIKRILKQLQSFVKPNEAMETQMASGILGLYDKRDYTNRDKKTPAQQHSGSVNYYDDPKILALFGDLPKNSQNQRVDIPKDDFMQNNANLNAKKDKTPPPYRMFCDENNIDWIVTNDGRKIRYFIEGQFIDETPEAIAYLKEIGEIE